MISWESSALSLQDVSAKADMLSRIDVYFDIIFIISNSFSCHSVLYLVSVGQLPSVPAVQLYPWPFRAVFISVTFPLIVAASPL